MTAWTSWGGGMASHFAGPNGVIIGLKKSPWASVSPSANWSCCSLDGGKDFMISPVLKSSAQCLANSTRSINPHFFSVIIRPLEPWSSGWTPGPARAEAAPRGTGCGGCTAGRRQGPPGEGEGGGKKGEKIPKVRKIRRKAGHGLETAAICSAAFGLRSRGWRSFSWPPSSPPRPVPSATRARPRPRGPGGRRAGARRPEPGGGRGCGAGRDPGGLRGGGCDPGARGRGGRGGPCGPRGGSRPRRGSWGAGWARRIAKGCGLAKTAEPRRERAQEGGSFLKLRANG